MDPENRMTSSPTPTAPDTTGAPVPLTTGAPAVRPAARGSLSRRAALAVGLAGAGAALIGCGTGRSPAPASASSGTAPSPAPSAIGRAEAELAALERRVHGRLGVYALDTGTGREVRHRAGERFLMCSTFKMLTAAAILRAQRDRPGLLKQVIHYRRSEVIDNSPTTSRHVDDGMTVAALCRAAITQSDNTAANLLLKTLGGPAAVTRFVRALGDPVTRLDHGEPDVNEADGVRDTTTPERIGADLRALTLGHALGPDDRDQLLAWLDANTTGDKAIRAAFPGGWRIGDKTGSGNHGESNDIAVIRPPHHDPLILTVYTAPEDSDSTTSQSTIAEAARIVSGALVPQG